MLRGHRGDPRTLYSQMYEQNVLLNGSILKASMVISGKDCPQRAGVKMVAEATVECLLNAVPAAVAGVVFLSGGQGNEEACLLYTSPSPRDRTRSRMPSSA